MQIMIGCKRLQARKKKFLILNFSQFFPEIIQLVYIQWNALGIKNTEREEWRYASNSFNQKEIDSYETNFTGVSIFTT